MTEKELGKLFKSKLDNREFAFNPANWEAMETILESAPKPAGAYYWRSVMAVLLFGVAVWSFITFAPAAAENRIVNKAEVAAPAKLSEEAREAISEKDELTSYTQQKEAASQALAEKTEVSKSVASLSAELDEQNATENTIMAKSAENIQSADGDELVEEEDVALVEPSPILPLSSKGFVFQNEMSQSIAEVDAIESFTPKALKKFDSKNLFYLEATPIFTGSYNANNVGVGWKVGLGWARTLGKKFQINVGLGYTVQNGVGIQNNSDSVFYNFGKEVVETQEINRRLDYIELPVSIGYKLNEKNMVELGMYAGYLVNMSRDVDKEISKFKSETEYQSSKERGYQKEFKRMDYALELGYRYRLTPALSVGLHYNFGLVDITKNTQGDYLQRHTNQNTRVVFRYIFL